MAPVRVHPGLISAWHGQPEILAKNEIFRWRLVMPVAEIRKKWKRLFAHKTRNTTLFLIRNLLFSNRHQRYRHGCAFTLQPVR